MINKRDGASPAEDDAPSCPESEASRSYGTTRPQRGTSNRNARGSSRDRKLRRRWLLVQFGDGHKAPCYRCDIPLDDSTITVDRIVPGAHGGRYTHGNIRPACQKCNSETGGAVRSLPSEVEPLVTGDAHSVVVGGVDAVRPSVGVDQRGGVVVPVGPVASTSTASAEIAGSSSPGAVDALVGGHVADSPALPRRVVGATQGLAGVVDGTALAQPSNVREAQPLGVMPPVATLDAACPLGSIPDRTIAGAAGPPDAEVVSIAEVGGSGTSRPVAAGYGALVHPATVPNSETGGAVRSS
jgi:5-methylcytosine-specific restriction endonuclease McrA